MQKRRYWKMVDAENENVFIVYLPCGRSNQVFLSRTPPALNVKFSPVVPLSQQLGWHAIILGQ